MRCRAGRPRDKRIATLGGVWYDVAIFDTEGWLSGLKRRFAKPLYGIKACTEGSNPSPSATFLPYSRRGGRQIIWHIAEGRSEEHTSELQSPDHIVCRLLLEKK